MHCNVLIIYTSTTRQHILEEVSFINCVILALKSIYCCNIIALIYCFILITKVVHVKKVVHITVHIDL